MYVGFIACISLKHSLNTIQTRALVCLNNMLSSIDVDHLGGPEAITLLWSKMIEIAFQNNGRNVPKTHRKF